MQSLTLVASLAKPDDLVLTSFIRFNETLTILGDKDRKQPVSVASTGMHQFQHLQLT